jgi:hypothetical protein
MEDLELVTLLDADAREANKLLERVVNWYDEKFMTGTFADIIADIRRHLNDTTVHNENTHQDTGGQN